MDDFVVNILLESEMLTRRSVCGLIYCVGFVIVVKRLLHDDWSSIYTCEMYSKSL